MSGWLDRKAMREVHVELDWVLQIHIEKAVVLARGGLVELLQDLDGMDGRQGFEQRLLLLGAAQGHDDIEARVHLHWRANRV